MRFVRQKSDSQPFEITVTEKMFHLCFGEPKVIFNPDLLGLALSQRSLQLIRAGYSYCPKKRIELRLIKNVFVQTDGVMTME